MRCVEAWSAVVPWVGFPLARLLRDIGPTDKAKYVRFTAVLDPKDMPGQQSTGFPWPYVEGLRLDEAMNDLTLLVTGIYGKPLPPQEGAPIRLVVPWKYGFKSIKAIVKIDLVEEMPVSFWMTNSPNEYGFYSNVNPDVPHPRWSQDSERRLGELKRPTCGLTATETGGVYLRGNGPQKELLDAAPGAVFDILVHIVILLPLILIVWDAAHGLLGANPIREIQLRTGRTALALLVLSLAGTPAFTLTRNRWAQVLRRRLSLYAFFYACLHLVNFVAIDYGFNFAIIREDTFKNAMPWSVSLPF